MELRCERRGFRAALKAEGGEIVGEKKTANQCHDAPPRSVSFMSFPVWRPNRVGQRPAVGKQAILRVLFRNYPLP